MEHGALNSKLVTLMDDETICYLDDGGRFVCSASSVLLSASQLCRQAEQERRTEML